MEVVPHGIFLAPSKKKWKISSLTCIYLGVSNIALPN
jgi:hypothetical protein